MGGSTHLKATGCGCGGGEKLQEGGQVERDVEAFLMQHLWLDLAIRPPIIYKAPQQQKVESPSKFK
jgi:hypothetical protein